MKQEKDLLNASTHVWRNSFKAGIFDEKDTAWIQNGMLMIDAPD